MIDRPRTGAARALHVAGVAFVVALGAAAGVGAVALLLRPDAWTLAAVPAGVALALLAWLRPVLAIALLLAAAPICGNRPTTGPFLAFIGLTACAVPGWLARLATRDRARLLDVLVTPPGLALAAYAGVSVLSLSSLPLYAVLDLVGASTAGEAVWLLPTALAAADVNATIYPLLTVILTLHALVAAVTIAVAVQRGGDGGATAPEGGLEAARLVTTGILIGLVVAVAAGPLDRLALIDLRALRSTDPFTNLSGAERLQSTFGHAGWFAEYVCFTTPAVLALWLWPRADAGRESEPRARRVIRTATAALLLAATLAVVVLSYQRGGWITWAIVGAGVTAAVVRLAAGAPAAAPTSARRLLAVAAVAMVVAFAAGLAVVRITGGSAAMERFAARARTITQVSDRQAHVMAGLRLGALLPILGGGSESFASRYEQEYLLAGGTYYARGYSPLSTMYGSAHNVFAQTFAGKGAAGLIALAWLVVAVGWAALQTLRRPDEPLSTRVVAAIAVGILAAFAIYGQVQEVFYVAPLQLTVFAACGLAAGLAPAGRQPASVRLGIVATVLLAVLAAHVVHAYVVPGRLAEGYRERAITLAGERLSAPVADGDGQYFQTTGARAVVTIPRQATALALELRRLAPEAQVVEIWLDDRLVDRVRLETPEWRRLAYPLGKLRALPRRLRLAVAPTWRAPGDARELGVGVRRIRWGQN
jgi:hypothetical protein